VFHCHAAGIRPTALHGRDLFKETESPSEITKLLALVVQLDVLISKMGRQMIPFEKDYLFHRGRIGCYSRIRGKRANRTGTLSSSLAS